MSKNAELRLRIFESYSTNLRLLLTIWNNRVSNKLDQKPFFLPDSPTYICPICGNGFLGEALDQSYVNPLTLEHLPPKSLGGKPLILTCKNCNNTSGYKLDKAVWESFITEQFFNKNPEIDLPIKISLNKSNKLKGTMKYSGDQAIDFKLFDKKNPYAKKKLQEIVHHWEGAKIDVEHTAHNPKVGWLRIGFLLAYSYLGNAILMDENSTKIRDQIIHPEKYTLPHELFMQIPEEVGKREGVHFVTKPEDIQSFLIVFSFKYKNIRKPIGVFYPAAGKLGWEKFANIRNLKSTDRLVLTDYTENNFLLSDKIVDGYYRISNIMTTKI